MQIHVLATVAVLLTPLAAQATTYIEYSGVITASQFPMFLAGSPYSLRYQWNGLVPGDPSPGIYPAAGTEMLLTLPGYSITAGTVSYRLGEQAGVHSSLSIAARWYEYQTSPPTPLGFPYLVDSTYFPFFAGVLFRDSTGRAFSGDLSLQPTYSLDLFDQRELEVAFTNYIDFAGVRSALRVWGTVDQVSIIPEPNGTFLMLLGLSGLCAFGRIIVMSRGTMRVTSSEFDA